MRIIGLQFIIALSLFAGNYPNSITAYRGTTPTLDGYLSPSEWDDADALHHDATWNSDAGKVKSAADYAMTCWVKHDGTTLYFAFDITDDTLYGIDIDAWLPDGNALAHELSPQGWPWFADGVEIFLNPENQWNNTTKKETKGDGASWKIVCSSYKSRLGGVGIPGLLEGEPRSSSTAWNNYQQWIENGSQQAVVRLKDAMTEGHGFIIEWKIAADPCLQIKPGLYWNASQGEWTMGLNIEIQDLDSKAAGSGNWSNFHHIDYWAAEQGKKELLERWGALILSPNAKSETAITISDEVPSPVSCILHPSYPNPFNDSTTISFTPLEHELMQLDLINVEGKIVRHVWHGMVGSGRQRFVWRGDDNAGNPLPSGVYFCLLQTKKEYMKGKIVLIR
ncbi:MAG: hypothetical protein EHM72_16940 [Calditrichaeota bacterium]|nr:MAG: hypothetical protein EHM72_16940 [Calditrichota bacterium]